MAIYDFDNYKSFFNQWVRELPNHGRGEYRRVAGALSVSTTMVSQVFKGEKHLSLELANDLCEYLSFNEEESDYFLLLVEYQRAGSHNLKKRFKRQIEIQQEKAEKLEERLKKDIEMSEDAKATFYSSWIYSAIRMLVAIDEYRDVNKVADALNLPRNQVKKVIDFLVKHNLCVEEGGQLKVGPARTHLGSSSLLVVKHHQNWRLKGFNEMVQTDDSNLFFTSPMSLSDEAAEKIRRELPNFIESVAKIVVPSTSETVRCLNIDWFKY